MRDQFEAEKNIRRVRKEQKLPKDGRGIDELLRLEKIFRRVMDPHVPSYDVNSVQSVDFDEWTYTEGLGAFMAFTQSVEVNARLMLAAADWDGEITIDHAAFIADRLADKWDVPAAGVSAEGLKVFFPPGNNLSWIVNTDNVLRAFDTDPAWRLKPHPITSDEDLRTAKLAFGITRLFSRGQSGMTLLRSCDTVGYTTASELGIVGMVVGKRAVDFSNYEYENCGRYHALYLALRRNTQLAAGTFLNRLFNCPWSGLVPIGVEHEDAAERFRLYRERTLELRRMYTPVTRALVPPPMQKRA